jgi:hypothetical protein
MSRPSLARRAIKPSLIEAAARMGGQQPPIVLCTALQQACQHYLATDRVHAVRVAWCIKLRSLTSRLVLVQPETERGRSPLAAYWKVCSTWRNQTGNHYHYLILAVSHARHLKDHLMESREAAQARVGWSH